MIARKINSFELINFKPERLKGVWQKNCRRPWTNFFFLLFVVVFLFLIVDGLLLLGVPSVPNAAALSLLLLFFSQNLVILRTGAA